MRSKAICLALLALVFGVRAESVLQVQAERAAGAWARTGASLGAQVGTSVAGSEEISVTNGVSVYAVRLTGGGTVFLSSDTEVEPIVAFTSNSDVDLSAESPFVRLLRLDAVARRRLAEKPASTSATSSTSAAAPASGSARKWAALLAAVPSAATATPSDSVSASAKPLSGLNDVRVAPLLKSKWNQKEGGGGYCWNYYTPNHIACGCTATAAAQIMRYFKWPTASMSPATYECELEGEPVKYTTMGGTFDWDNMPYVLTGTVSEDKRKAIGHLAYDVGVALQTSYSESSGGSAVPKRLGEVYRIFKYANGYQFWDGTSFYTGKGGLHSLDLRKRIIYANLDAGRPVQLAIYGYPKAHMYDEDHWAGHSVVGDGYGFNVVGDVETAYVHINMGWSGLDDMWYNIPEIDAANSGAHVGDSGYDFLYMGGAAFNIFPEESGKEILSGRVTDDDDKGVKGARVTARLDGAVVQTVTTDANGIYAFSLAGDRTYDISAVSDDGKQLDEIDGVILRKTVGNSARVVSDSTNVGNSWGNDMTLVAPDVRIVVGDVTNIYSCLDKALAAAKAFSAADPSVPVVIEVIDDTELQASFTVDFPCEIRCAEGLFTVLRGKDVKLVVAAGGRLGVSDVVFTGATTTLIDVAEGGGVCVGAGVDFGVPATVAAIQTADAEGFTVTAVPAEWYAVSCTAATDLDSVFGYADCDFTTATSLAAKFVNLNDPNGEISGEAVDVGSAPYPLKWSLLPVPLEDASAYYVLNGTPETTNCFRRLDRLFELFEEVDEPAEITVVRNGTLSRKVTLKSDLRLVSPTDAVVSNLAATAGFVIGAGKTLKVDGVSFDGYKGDALFLVDGGRLELGGDMAVRNVDGANALYSGAVAVRSGSAVIGSAGGTVVFENCLNGHPNACGGAVYLAGSACDLTLQNAVSITGCRSGLGGGVYMANGSVVRLSGYLTVTNNTSAYSSAGADDIYYKCNTTDVGTLRLVGPVATGSRVGILIKGNAARSLSQAGASFLTVDGAFSDRPGILQSSEAFFYDGKPELLAEPGSDYSTLRWFVDAGGVKEVSPAAAVARVAFSGGSVGWYGSLEDAFAMAEGDSIIELLADVEVVSNMTANGSVTLRSGFGGPFAVTRVAQCGFAIGDGASLTLENLTVNGRLDETRGGDGLLFDVQQGELTLGDGAIVRNVSGGDLRAAGAIKVYKGTVTLRTGSVIRDCANSYLMPGSENSRGGGITADSLSTVRFLGGVIEKCSANRGAAAFIGNESTVEIEGDFTATNNAFVPGQPNNVSVAATSQLLLTGKLTGRVGYLPGVNADPYVFGRVADGFSGSDADIANSAHNFGNDANGDVGMAVRNGSETLLVWSDGLDVNGDFVWGGKTYAVVVDGNAVRISAPAAIPSLVYTGAEQVGVEAGHGFVVSDDRKTNAGKYVATLSLKPGFSWADGSTENPRTVAWEIAPASLTVTAVACGKAKGEADPALTYSVSGLQGSDSADDVLSGELERVPGEDPGTYAILQGTLAVVGPNYTLTYVGADFTITGPEPPPVPPTPTPVPCVPFAFTAILNPSEGSWQLTISPAVKYCTYTVFASDDLVSWTPVVVDEEATADGEMTFTQAVTGPQKFWKAVGKDGEKPAEE